MARSVTYEVGITFCNGRSFKRDHDKLHEALQEYTAMLGAALDPSVLTSADAKHVRLVTFLGFDEQGQVVQHLTSPTFECDDQVVA